MLRILMKLKAYLPQKFWRMLRSLYWSFFWKKEQRRQSRELGQPCGKLAGSERAMLVEAIGDSSPFYSLLELGCSYGQNFHIFSKQHPYARLVGIDKDILRLRGGMVLAKEKNLSNVRLYPCEAEHLRWFPDKSFEIVITAALLLYLSPERIEQVVREMLRVCQRKIIMLEQHIVNETNDPLGLGSIVEEQDTDKKYWIRDYQALFKRYVSKEKITLTRIANPLWKAERWQELGHIIEVDL